MSIELDVKDNKGTGTMSMNGQDRPFQLVGWNALWRWRGAYECSPTLHLAEVWFGSVIARAEAELQLKQLRL